MRVIWVISFILFTSTSFAQVREIAITIDDLPLVASLMNTPKNAQRSTERFTRMVDVLSAQHVPATGFVIGGAIEKGQWAFLQQFRAAGLSLGNHTYSHQNLNETNVDAYIADIDRADKRLAPLLTEPKYFRYPYLAEGSHASQIKVQAYLTTHHYEVAPVTIDSKDFEFNERLYKVPFREREQYIQQLKPIYLAYIWKQTLKAEKKSGSLPVKQILLLHANLLNSYLLGDVIEMYRQNGYTFVTLTEALKNPAPKLSFPFLKSLVPSQVLAYTHKQSELRI